MACSCSRRKFIEILQKKRQLSSISSRTHFPYLTGHRRLNTVKIQSILIKYTNSLLFRTFKINIFRLRYFQFILNIQSYKTNSSYFLLTFFTSLSLALFNGGYFICTRTLSVGLIMKCSREFFDCFNGDCSLVFSPLRSFKSICNLSVVVLIRVFSANKPLADVATFNVG